MIFLKTLLRHAEVFFPFLTDFLTGPKIIPPWASLTILFTFIYLQNLEGFLLPFSLEDLEIVDGMIIKKKVH